MIDEDDELDRIWNDAIKEEREKNSVYWKAFAFLISALCLVFVIPAALNQRDSLAAIAAFVLLGVYVLSLGAFIVNTLKEEENDSVKK